MKVVIDIPEKTYNRILNNEYDYGDLNVIIQNGTPLPKGYGRLFDERDIIKGNYEVICHRIYELEPVLEAEKEADLD